MPKHHQDKGSALKWIYNILLRAAKGFTGDLFLCIVGEQIQEILNVWQCYISKKGIFGISKKGYFFLPALKDPERWVSNFRLSAL